MSSKDNPDNSKDNSGKEMLSEDNPDTSSRTIPGQETSSRENPDKSSTSRDYSKATIPGDSSTHPGRMGRSSDYVISNFGGGSIL